VKLFKFLKTTKEEGSEDRGMKLRKIIAMSIVACSIMSGAISSVSYADETSLGGNTNSGGSMDSGTDAAYAHKFMAYPENQGYRISVVDKNGDRVTNSVDIVNYAPNDLLNGRGLSQTTNTVGGETYLGGFNQYANYLGWDDYSSSGSGINKKNYFFYSNGIKTERFDSKTWITGGVPNKSGKYGTITTEMYPMQAIKDAFAINYNSYADLYGATKITEAIVNFPLPSRLNKNTGTFEAGGTDLMNYLQTYMIKNGGSKDIDADKIINNASVFMNMAILLRDSSGNPTSSASYLFRFIDPALQRKIGTKDVNGKNITQSELIALNGYKVIIEPLYWFVPEFLTTDSTLISMSKHKNSFNSFKGVCYGTASYISKYAEEALKDIKIIDDIKMKKIWVGPNWATANLGITTMMIATTDADLGIKEPSQAGLSAQDSLANSFSLYDLANNMNYKITGYSLHIYDKVFISSNALSTWDNQPNEGPSPTPKTPPVIPQNGVAKNVVKFYMKKGADGTTYVPYKNYTTKNTSSEHSVVNEDNGKYKVDSWFVSKTFNEPTSDSTNYHTLYNSLPRSQAGTGPGTVSLSDANGETTLYIKLIADTSGNLVDLKGLQQLNLYQNELSYPYNLASFRSDGSLEELHYTFPNMYEEGTDEVEHTHHEQGPDGEDREYTETESKPWHRRLSDSSYSINLLNGFDYNSTSFIGGSGSFAGREGGKVNTSNSNRGADIYGFNSESLNPNYSFNYYRDKAKDLVTLYPNKNSGGVINELGLIGISNPSYSPNQARVAASGEGSYTNTFNSAYDYNSLDKTLSWEEVGGDHRDGSGSYDGNPNRDVSSINGVYNVENNLNTNYYMGTSTGQDSSGISHIDKSGFSRFGMTFADDSSALNYSTTVSNTRNMQFYPFIRMNYKTIDSGSNPINVIVTGNQLRSYIFNNTVDVAVYKEDITVPSLSLESNQWNMHSRTQSFLARNKIKDKESVLPGGAVYTLKNNDKGQRWIGVRTYQVVMPDGDMSKKVSGDIQSYSEANGVLNSFLNEIPNTLNNYNIEQWVKRGLVDDSVYTAFGKSSDGTNLAKVSGTNNSRSKLFTKLWSSEKNYADVYINGQATSTLNKNILNTTSDKYYLKANSNSVNGAKLSVIDSKSDRVVWTLKADEAGNITVSNDKGLSATINSKQSAGNLLSKSADIATMDSRTHAVSNFVATLERNKGTDRNGQPWYNEGFESIQVIESYNAYRIGFDSSAGSGGVRSSALDPKLTGYLRDRSDTFRYGDEEYFKNSATKGAPITDANIKDIMSNKVRSSLFKTSNYSESNPSIDGYIGSFDGQDITVGDMDFLMFSKTFYIPNATVMDLN
jgi:hypothetical protein